MTSSPSHAASLAVLRARKLAWMMRRPRWRSLLRYGFGPSLEHQDLLSGHHFASIVDIGANRGQFAAWADEMLAPSTIHCFEPQPNSVLREVAARCRAEVHVHAVALGASQRDADLFVTAADDSSSLLRPTAEAVTRHRGLRIERARTVEVLRGDDVLRTWELPRPLLTKIDVQGTESDVLRGLPGVLEKSDAVLVELSLVPVYDGQSEFGDVVALLSDAGFQANGASPVPGASHGILEQVDVLFTRALESRAGDTGRTECP